MASEAQRAWAAHLEREERRTETAVAGIRRATLEREVEALRGVIAGVIATAEGLAERNLDADGEATDASSVAQVIANAARRDLAAALASLRAD